MDKKPSWRDAFFAAPQRAKEIEREAAPKESLEQILQNEFKADMRRLKIGGLLVWHIGCALFALLFLFIALGTIYHLVFG